MSSVAAPQAVAGPAFAFARRHGILVSSIQQGVAHCACRSDVTPTAIAEVRRIMGLSLHCERVDEPTFDRLLRVTYETGGAMLRGVEGLEETTDLADLALDLPEQADLLESDDDAPIIRLINALLTQALKENITTKAIQ